MIKAGCITERDLGNFKIRVLEILGSEELIDYKINKLGNNFTFFYRYRPNKRLDEGEVPKKNPENLRWGTR